MWRSTAFRERRSTKAGAGGAGAGVVAGSGAGAAVAHRPLYDNEHDTVKTV
jgi:hypothetical protein